MFWKELLKLNEKEVDDWLYKIGNPSNKMIDFYGEQVKDVYLYEMLFSLMMIRLIVQYRKFERMFWKELLKLNEKEVDDWLYKIGNPSNKMIDFYGEQVKDVYLYEMLVEHKYNILTRFLTPEIDHRPPVYD